MTTLIVALDLPAPQAGSLLLRLHREAQINWFKIGRSLLMDRSGMILIENIKHNFPNVKLMFDLKIWDTPDTTARDTRAAFALGATFLTIRAGIGDEEQVDAARVNTPDPCAILLVGNLTSAPQQANPIVYNNLLDNRSIGAVVPAVDLRRARELHPNAVLVTPGIRLDTTNLDDHHRLTVATPKSLVKLGATYAVVGRPIYNAADPVQTAILYREELQ